MELKDYPEIIDSNVKMDNPNEVIPIYDGDFELRFKGKTLKLEGDIHFKWFPKPEAAFFGTVVNPTNDLADSMMTSSVYEGDAHLYVGNDCFGKCAITSWSQNRQKEYFHVEGKFDHPVVFGDKSIPVERIVFGIPNIRSFAGELVRDTTKITTARMMLMDVEFVINLDRISKFDELNKTLKSIGGYVLLYTGEMYKQKGPITFKETTNLRHCLSTFLTFLNGRRCALFFSHGLAAGKKLWTDYSSYLVDPYKYAFSCASRRKSSDNNQMWHTFIDLWKQEDDRDFLTSVIHWYVSANARLGFIEGAIIMAQTALELIYNWMLIERRRLIVGQDAETISASNKIRLLLSYLKVSPEFPAASNYLTKLKSREIIDAPEAIVQIRNAVVHSHEQKRKKLRSIENLAKHEALETALWYIELSILNILQYEGEYRNRTAKIPDVEERVPWTKS